MFRVLSSICILKRQYVGMFEILQMLLIFQALENILLRTASDLSHFRVVGMNIVKKLINSYMKLIYAALYSETHR